MAKNSRLQSAPAQARLVRARTELRRIRLVAGGSGDGVVARAWRASAGVGDRSVARECNRMAPSRRMRARACAALLLCACHPRDDGGIDRFGAVSEKTAADPLESVVNSSHVTDRIATATLENKQAAVGSTFVVLDVTVRNPGTQPQVFSEGKLVAVTAARERTSSFPLRLRPARGFPRSEPSGRSPVPLSNRAGHARKSQRPRRL